MWCDIAYLGFVSKTTNEIGDTVEKINYSNGVFCNEKSVKYNEFYQAQATGLKPEIVLQVKEFDYNQERYIKYNDIEYTVIRTYRTQNECIELTLQRGL